MRGIDYPELGWGGAADDTEFIRRLYARAAEMRKNPTPFEVIVWRNLNRSQLSGFKFRRQHVIVPFIVDFFCADKNLAVEIDGMTHDHEKDRARDSRLAAAGIQTLHFTNEEVANNIDGVMFGILTSLELSSDRWVRQPHPNPSPEGEGL